MPAPDRRVKRALLLVLLSASVVGCKCDSGGGRVEPPAKLPPSLAVPEAGNTVLLRAYAKGVQMYTCWQEATEAGVNFAWVFKEPKADLFSDAKMTEKIGTHWAGPAWAYSPDGSSVVGELVAKETVDATAIPWLLLKAHSSSGNGLMPKVHFIQRVDTKAGKPPTTPCDRTNLGEKTNVDYTATYYFYGVP